MMTESHPYHLAGYPKEITLRNGSRIVLTPMTQNDAGALLRFFLKMPSEDRYYLKEDVTLPTITQRWARELDYERVLPLLAWSEQQIVADATLHRGRGGSRQHVGELRALVVPGYRGLGIGTALLQELTTMAKVSGLEHLVFEAVSGREEGSIKSAKFLGFDRACVLHDHAKDLDRHLRDLVIMEMPLSQWTGSPTF